MPKKKKAVYAEIVEGNKLTILASEQVEEILKRCPPIRCLDAIVAILSRLADHGRLINKDKYEEYAYKKIKICSVKHKSTGVRIYGWRSKIRKNTMIFCLAIENKKSNKLNESNLDAVYKKRSNYEND